MQTQMQVAGEARASAVGTGARGSTICNGHTRSGGRLLPFIRRLRAPVALLSCRRLLRRHRCSKTHSRSDACHEAHDASGHGHVRCHVRAEPVFSCGPQRKCADTEPEGSRVRAFFAVRDSTACGRPQCESNRRDSHRLASSSARTAGDATTRAENLHGNSQFETLWRGRRAERLGRLCQKENKFPNFLSKDYTIRASRIRQMHATARNAASDVCEVKI